MDNQFHLQLNVHRLDGSVDEFHILTDYDPELHDPLIAASKAQEEARRRQKESSKDKAAPAALLSEGLQLSQHA